MANSPITPTEDFSLDCLLHGEQMSLQVAITAAEKVNRTLSGFRDILSIDSNNVHAYEYHAHRLQQERASIAEMLLSHMVQSKREADRDSAHWALVSLTGIHVPTTTALAWQQVIEGIRATNILTAQSPVGV